MAFDLNPGILTQFITVYPSVTAKDEYGDNIYTWDASNGKTMRANANVVSTAKALIGEQNQVVYPYDILFKVNRFENVVDTDLISYNNRYYRINKIRQYWDDIASRPLFQELECSEWKLEPTELTNTPQTNVSTND